MDANKCGQTDVVQTDSSDLGFDGNLRLRCQPRHQSSIRTPPPPSRQIITTPSKLRAADRFQRPITAMAEASGIDQLFAGPRKPSALMKQEPDTDYAYDVVTMTACDLDSQIVVGSKGYVFSRAGMSICCALYYLLTIYYTALNPLSSIA